MAMKITAFKAQIKNPERVSVYVDGEYAFSLNHPQLLEQKLRIGLEIDDARLQELKKASDFGKAYERALNYATIRPRSVREVQQYCQRKKWPPQDCAAIIQKLVAHGYVNDHNFARAWVQNRAMGNKTSRRKLVLELKQKGIAEDIVRGVLATDEFDEQAALKMFIAKKRKLLRYANDNQKLMQYLARQGFGFDDIKTALKSPD